MLLCVISFYAISLSESCSQNELVIAIYIVSICHKEWTMNFNECDSGLFLTVDICNQRFTTWLHKLSQ